MSGGQKITITGKGFDESTTLTLCDVECDAVEAVTATTYICFTPVNGGDGTVTCDIKVSL